MGEHLADMLLRAKDPLRWLEKYELANALILFSRLARVRNLDSLDALEAYVEQEESRLAPAEEP